MKRQLKLVIKLLTFIPVIPSSPSFPGSPLSPFWTTQNQENLMLNIVPLECQHCTNIVVSLRPRSRLCVSIGVIWKRRFLKNLFQNVSRYTYAFSFVFAIHKPTTSGHSWDQAKTSVYERFPFLEVSVSGGLTGLGKGVLYKVPTGRLRPEVQTLTCTLIIFNEVVLLTYS